MIAGVDLGPIAIVAALVLGVCVFLFSLSAVAAAIGWAATRYAEDTHAGSELVHLNR